MEDRGGDGCADTALGVLRRRWGYDGFRGPQLEVIEAAVRGRDTLVVMATGAGKSLCMQVPPLVLGRPGVVVSPLISLMQDQVQALQKRGVRACLLGSAQADPRVREDAWAGRYELVYLTPELALASVERLARLHAASPLALLAVDEAHCISEWGADYRPEYLRLGELRDALPGVPFMALTATATPRVQLEVARLLRLRPPPGSPAGGVATWRTSFERPNLRFEVRRRPDPRTLVAELACACADACCSGSSSGGGSAIVYVLTVRQAEELAEKLAAAPRSAPLAPSAYHAKLDPDERARVHAAFVSGACRVVVATLAYGMGIDQADVRLVAHVGAPASPEAYYQQAGRAGRDGLPATCRLYWSAADLATVDFVRSGGGGSSGSSVAQGQARSAATTAVQAYCASSACRAALLVNHFVDAGDPAQVALRLPPDGPCRGGCDNCERRASRGGEVATRDFGPEARLLLRAVRALDCRFGVGRAVDLLLVGGGSAAAPEWLVRRARALGLEPGAGASVSAERGLPSGKATEAWWRALAGSLVAAGLVQYRSVIGHGRAFSAPTLTASGAAAAAPERDGTELLLPVSEELARAEAGSRPPTRRLQTPAGGAARTSAGVGAKGGTSSAVALYAQLADERKRAAAELGVSPPSQLASDLLLRRAAVGRVLSLPDGGWGCGVDGRFLPALQAALRRHASTPPPPPEADTEAADRPAEEARAALLSLLEEPKDASVASLELLLVILPRSSDGGLPAAAAVAVAAERGGIRPTTVLADVARCLAHDLLPPGAWRDAVRRLLARECFEGSSSSLGGAGGMAEAAATRGTRRWGLLVGRSGGSCSSSRRAAAALALVRSEPGGEALDYLHVQASAALQLSA